MKRSTLRKIEALEKLSIARTNAIDDEEGAAITALIDQQLIALGVKSQEPPPGTPPPGPGPETHVEA